jgi:hypothetical protein
MDSDNKWCILGCEILKRTRRSDDFRCSYPDRAWWFILFCFISFYSFLFYFLYHISIEFNS